MSDNNDQFSSIAATYDCWVFWSTGPQNLGPKTIAACAGRRVPGVGIIIPHSAQFPIQNRN